MCIESIWKNGGMDFLIKAEKIYPKLCMLYPYLLWGPLQNAYSNFIRVLLNVFYQIPLRLSEPKTNKELMSQLLCRMTNGKVEKQMYITHSLKSLQCHLVHHRYQLRQRLFMLRITPRSRNYVPKIFTTKNPTMWKVVPILWITMSYIPSRRRRVKSLRKSIMPGTSLNPSS